MRGARLSAFSLALALFAAMAASVVLVLQIDLSGDVREATPCEVDPDSKECKQLLQNRTQALTRDQSCHVARKADAFVEVDGERYRLLCPLETEGVNAGNGGNNTPSGLPGPVQGPPGPAGPQGPQGEPAAQPTLLDPVCDLTSVLNVC